MNIRILIITFFSIVSIASAQNVKNESYSTRAKEKLDAGNYKEALKLYNKAIGDDNLNKQLYLERGKVKSGLNDITGALDDYSYAIILDPSFIMGYLHRAMYLQSLRQFEYAIEDFNSALTLANDIDSLKFGILNNRGVSKLQIRDFEGAYSDFMAILAYDSLHQTALANIGTILDNLGRGQEAIEYLEKVVKYYPDFGGGYGNLAFRYAELGDYDKALELNNKVIELEKDNPIAFNNRGHVKYKLGLYNDALDDINKSIKMYPGNSYAYKNRALVYLELGKINPACKDLETAINYGFTKMYGTEVKELKEKYCKGK